MKKIITIICLLAVSASLLTTACSNRDKNLGTDKNPVRIMFMPSAGKTVSEKDANIIAKQLEKLSGLKVKTTLAADYITIIDAIATKRTDIAVINSLGYLLARDWCGAKAILQLRGIDGKMDYTAAIITNVSSKVKTLKDLNDKTFAYTTPFSMAGYIMPLYMFTESDIKPSSTSFVETFEDVVNEVYKNEIAGGSIFYHKPDPYGRINDARSILIDKHPDMLDKVQTIAFSDPIPNPPVIFRKEIPTDVEAKLSKAFVKLTEDPATLTAIQKIYDASGFAPANEQSFDKIRNILKKLGKSVKEVVPGGVTFFKKHVWEAVPEY